MRGQLQHLDFYLNFPFISIHQTSKCADYTLERAYSRANAAQQYRGGVNNPCDKPECLSCLYRLRDKQGGICAV